MSLKQKVYDGYLIIGKADMGKFYMGKDKRERIPVVLKYREGGIKSGMMVAVAPEDLELVLTALRKMEPLTNGQELVDRILGEGIIEMSNSNLIIPANGKFI